MKPKRRKIRLSFIGGRRPVFLEENKDEKTKSDDSKGINGENKAKIENRPDEVTALISTKKIIKDKAISSEYASGKNPSQRNNGEPSNILETTLCASVFQDMREITPALEKELENWKMLTSDFVFKTYERFELNSELSKVSEFLAEQDKLLLENHMKLYMKNCKLKELHTELELKTALLQQQIEEQTVNDSVLGASVIDTPRHLIKKIISLN